MKKSAKGDGGEKGSQRRWQPTGLNVWVRPEIEMGGWPGGHTYPANRRTGCALARASGRWCAGLHAIALHTEGGGKWHHTLRGVGGLVSDLSLNPASSVNQRSLCGL